MSGVVDDTIEGRAASLFRAMSHPGRVAMLAALVPGEVAAGALGRALGLESSTASHQLAVLRQAGLVRSRRAGSLVLCRLGVPEVALLLEAADEIIATALARNTT